MGEKYLHEIEGTAALATHADARHQARVIDYDIARRSHEARQRLARRQAARNRAAGEGKRSVEAVSRAPLAQPAHQQMTLQKLVSESYEPNRTVAEFLADAFAKCADAIVSHPLWVQAKTGSLAGKDFGHLTDRQIVSATAVTTVVGAAMIFIGM